MIQGGIRMNILAGLVVGLTILGLVFITGIMLYLFITIFGDE